MTRDEIMALEPNNLDEQIAIKLFGWRWCATDGGHYSESMDGGKKGSYIDARVRRFLSPGWDTGKHAERWKQLNTVECSKAAMRLPIGYSYYPDWPFPSYSQTWEGMRLVVEWMAANGWEFEISGGCTGKKGCMFSKDDDSVAKYAEGETAPHAVCLAALLAMGG